MTALATVVSVLRETMPDVATPALTAPLIGRETEIGALRDAWARAARSAPVLVVIEDLHWSDPSTRDLLLFLLSRLGNSRILVLLTYRSDDLFRQHPLRPWLASVARMRGVQRVDVDPWGPEDARAFARALLPAGDVDVDDDVIADVAKRSEGNAFFAEELMSAASGGATELSDVLTSVLLDRIERLSSAAQRVVRAAAIVGQRDLWASSLEGLVATEVVGLAPSEIESALRECVQSHVLVVAHNGAYAFRHALLREAVLADLLPGESARLHGAYVAVLEQEQPSGWQAAIAFHATRAGDLSRALKARLEATTVAGEYAAHSDALAHVEKALQLWPAVTDPEGVTGVDELTLVLRACDEATAAARTDRALSYARAGVEMADSAGDVLQQAGARRRIAKLLYNTGEWREAERQIALAWALLENEPSTAERAWVMSAMSFGEVTPERRELAERAIVEARAVGASGPEADALISVAFLLQHEGDVDGAMERLQEARVKAREGGSDDTELRAYFNMAILRYDHGRIPEAVEIAKEGVSLAARHGRSWSGYGRELTWLLCLMDVARGAFTEVMTRTTAALESVPAGERALVLATRVLAASWVGDWKVVDADVAALGTAEQVAGGILSGRSAETMAGYGLVHSWLWRGRADLVEDALTAAMVAPEFPDELAEIRVGAMLLAARADAGGQDSQARTDLLERVERVARVRGAAWQGDGLRGADVARARTR